MNGNHALSPFDEQQWRLLDETSLTVDDFTAAGLILDVGGGGEGVITRLKGEQVIAIDLSARELQAIPGTALRMVMDARDLKFLDDSFQTVTAFFSLMYSPIEDHERIFQEVFRVLKPGGRFLVWDANLPPRESPQQKYILLPMKICLPGAREPLDAAFGTYWRDTALDQGYYLHIAQKAGFALQGGKEEGPTFFMELAKP